MYEYFEHTADLGLRVRAPELSGLFGSAAEGLMAMIVEDAVPQPNDARRRIVLEGSRLDWLMFDWLSELLALFEIERVLVRRVEVQVDTQGLVAELVTTPLDRSRHRLLHEVKAVTYHGLRVEPDADGWIAEIIVDI